MFVTSLTLSLSFQHRLSKHTGVAMLAKVGYDPPYFGGNSEEVNVNTLTTTARLLVAL
jgi:hypothetical protein